MNSASGTPHDWAAAAISIWRQAAPTCRSGSQCKWAWTCCRRQTAGRIGVLVDVGLFDAHSFHSTSSSSATSMGSIVLTPCPISGFLAITVTTPLASMRINATAMNAGGLPGPCAGQGARRGPARRRRRQVRSFSETRGDRDCCDRHIASLCASFWRRQPHDGWPAGCADRFRSGRDCSSWPCRCPRQWDAAFCSAAPRPP